MLWDEGKWERGFELSLISYKVFMLLSWHSFYHDVLWIFFGLTV